MGGAENIYNPAGQSDFFLKKWYVDAADYLGHVYIGYWLFIRWGKLKLHGYQHLWHTPGEGMRTQLGLGKLPEPCWQNRRQMIWRTDKFRSSWESASDPISETLLSSEQGDIKWQCFQPKANALIELPQISFQGWGYSECLELTIPVWKLPLNNLYWGRCHTENHTLVWIKWGGPSPRRLIWHNGRQTSLLSISKDHIQGSDFCLAVEEKIPLSRGRLSDTVFKTIDTVMSLFSNATFISEENKWYGRGRLETPTATEPATIIYEEVSW